MSINLLQHLLRKQLHGSCREDLGPGHCGCLRRLRSPIMAARVYIWRRRFGELDIAGLAESSAENRPAQPRDCTSQKKIHQTTVSELRVAKIDSWWKWSDREEAKPLDQTISSKS